MKHVVAYRSLPPAVLGLLREHCSVEVVDVSSGELAPFRQALGTAHGMVGNNLKITPEILDAAPLLEVASTISAGFDAFDVPELSRRGIVLTNTPEEVTEKQRVMIGSATFFGGHHTVYQHAHFEFGLENISRQFVWSFLHAHPFYNSEQQSQRYVRLDRAQAYVPPESAKIGRAHV